MFDYLILAGIAFSTAISLYALHKIRRIHLATFDLRTDIAQLHGRHLIDLHQQLQELARLQFALKLEQPLPLTRGWAASPDFLRLVSNHVLAEKPDTVVELGSGTSTIVVARSLQLNGGGHLYSYDHEPEFAEQTRANLRQYGLSDWATVIDAPLGESIIEGKPWKWYSLPELPDRPLDLLIIDGPPEATGPLARYPAGPILFPRVADGGAVFLDDADRPDEREAARQWLTQFPDMTLGRPWTEKGCAILRRPAAAPRSVSARVEEMTSA